MTSKATYTVLVSLTLGVLYENDIKQEGLETGAKTLQGDLAKAIPIMFKYYPSYELSNLQVEVEPRELE